jgi:GNAT superfamily N-acetyltransferase
MHEPRAPREAEVEQVLGFLNRHLRPGAGWSIASEYPQVFTSGNLGNIRIITENNQILAHAALKYLLVKNQLGLFKVAAIGSVVTDPNYRNQGLSQKILENCLVAAEREGADFAILWTDLYDFYRKFGFELAGSEISILVQSAPIQNNLSLRIMKSEKVSAESILRLYSQHTCSTMRTVDDMHKYLRIPNSNIYTAWNPENQILAYAVEGKGADLKGYVHEWGGQIQHLLPLLAHIRNDYGAPITVIAPSHAHNLIRNLQKWDVLLNQGYLGMIKPVHLENLFFKIRRHARNIGLADFVIEKIGSEFHVGTKEDTARVGDIHELTRLLFGPLDSSRLMPQYQKVFPIPMWVWGWDSV